MTSLCEPPAENRRHPAAGQWEARQIDPLSDPQWDRLVAHHPEAGIFHTSAWAKVLAQAYGHRPFYLAYHQDGHLAALVPLMEVRSILTGRRGVSVPFADFCGPLLFDGCDRGALTKSLTSLASSLGWRHLEFRGGEALQSRATPSVSFFAHSLDLRPGPEKLMAGMEPSVRRAIRKAERSGLTTAVRSDEEAVRTFYRLHVHTRRRHGLPPQPLAFFRNIHREILARGLGSVVVASRGTTTVAASIFFHSGRQAVYKYGASDDKLQELRGSNLTMWAGIRFLAERGSESLHFGRTSTTQDGLRRFKLSWGAAESTLPYYKLAPRTATWLPGRDKASGTHNVVFSRLPLALNRLLGRLLYPHLD